MIPFLALVKKELGSVFRDRTILIAILILTADQAPLWIYQGF